MHFRDYRRRWVSFLLLAYLHALYLLKDYCLTPSSPEMICLRIPDRMLELCTMLDSKGISPPLKLFNA